MVTRLHHARVPQVRAGVAERRCPRAGLGPGGRRGVQDLEDARGSPRHLPCSRGTGHRLPQRQVCLRGRAAGPASPFVAEVAVQQPKPDLDRDAAVASAAASSSTSPDRNATRKGRHGCGPVVVGDLGDHVLLRLARPNTLSVGKPSTTSRKRPPRAWPAAATAAASALWYAIRPGPENRDQRQRHGDDHCGDPVRDRHRPAPRSAPGPRGRAAAGSGRIGIQPVQAPGAQGGDLARRRPPSDSGSELQRAGGERAAQALLTVAAARSAVTSPA